MSSSGGAEPRRGVLPEVAVALWAVLVAAFVTLGSDLLWVVTLGDLVRDTGSVPDGIPFASAPQGGWHNPIVVAEVLLSLVHAMGPLALAALQVGLVATTLGVLVAEGRRLGGGEVAIAVVVSLVVVGCAAAFVIARLPSLSLVPFVLALAVMRRQHLHPDRGLWLLVPLYVVWGNLHGGVLVGLAVLGVFLVTSPGGGSLLRRAGVGLGCLSALVLTSATLSTPQYYVSALTNEAAARGSDLWARFDPTHPLDAAMGVVVLVLLVRAVRRRPPLWEVLALVGLLAGTASAARNGVWLVLFLAAAALRARGGAVKATDPRRDRSPVGAVVVAVVGAIAVGGALASRGPAAGPVGAAAVDVVRQVAAGRPVLADEPLAETLAQAGVGVWAANPIDAFPREVQAEFLDFLRDGTPPPLASDVEVAAVKVDLVDGLTATGEWTEGRRAGGVAVLERVP